MKSVSCGKGSAASCTQNGTVMGIDGRLGIITRHCRSDAAGERGRCLTFPDIDSTLSATNWTARVAIAPAFSCAKMRRLHIPAGEMGITVAVTAISDQLELPYRVDPERRGKQRATGVCVRAALANGEMVTADLAELDRHSLQRWLRSRGDSNFLPEAVSLLLLEHVNTTPGLE